MRWEGGDVGGGEQKQGSSDVSVCGRGADFQRLDHDDSSSSGLREGVKSLSSATLQSTPTRLLPPQQIHGPQ